MTNNSSINPDVEGCFEATLAVRLRTGKHLQPQEAISLFGWRLSPEERLELATALYWEFCGRLCRVRHNEQSLQILQEKYNQIRDFVAPIYRLPPEILAEIFSIDVEGRQSPIRLMLVCQYWYTVVDSMASMCESLKLGTWTPPSRVERSLKRAGWLNVVIHTEEDIEKGQGDGGAYIALASAAASASRWKRLTIESLPHERLEAVTHPVPSFASLSPIRELNHLKTASQAESSPLLTQLLENIGSAAVGNLSTIETTSLYTIQHLLQPAYVQSFHSLTTLHMAVRKTGDSVDLLPHLLRLEVLHITNVSLPSYADDLNLPLTSSLRQLYLKAVSVQWMGGRTFPKLQSCAINSPPRYPPLSSDIDCPICTDLEFRNWNVRVAGQFRTPMIHSLVIKSNEWTPVRGSKQVILLCSVGLGFQLQPRVLHLATLCKECVLLAILELLPALEELRLDIERPCALGRRFFTSLLAKPMNDLKSDIHREWEALPMGIETRTSAICPSLKRLELKYERWLRQTEQLDFLPPLMALSWSREGTTTPLESFRLCFKDSDAQWKVFEPKGLDMSNEILDFLQLQPFLIDDFFFKSCVMATATSMISHHMLFIPMGEFQRLLPLFGFYFRHLCVLRIDVSYQLPNFEILPNFFRLEELDLSSVDIPSYSIEIDLPFVRTLRRLSLHSTTLTWMDGRVFPRLKRFYLCNDRPVHFPKTASLPVCTHIKYLGEDDDVLQSAFLVPALIDFHRSQGYKKEESVGILPASSDHGHSDTSITHHPSLPPAGAGGAATYIPACPSPLQHSHTQRIIPGVQNLSGRGQPAGVTHLPPVGQTPTGVNKHPPIGGGSSGVSAGAPATAAVVSADGQPRPKYTRRKAGCLVCRQKQVKCDEKKPTCTRCLHGYRECSWPKDVPSSTADRGKAATYFLGVGRDGANMRSDFLSDDNDNDDIPQNAVSPIQPLSAISSYAAGGASAMVSTSGAFGAPGSNYWYPYGALRQLAAQSITSQAARARKNGPGSSGVGVGYSLGAPEAGPEPLAPYFRTGQERNLVGYDKTIPIPNSNPLPFVPSLSILPTTTAPHSSNHSVSSFPPPTPPHFV